MKDSSKRKRKREDIENVKEEENALKEDKQLFLQKSKRLKMDNDNLLREIVNLKKFEDLVQHLH